MLARLKAVRATRIKFFTVNKRLNISASIPSKKMLPAMIGQMAPLEADNNWANPHWIYARSDEILP
jgi:hypothetical protein